jgi:FG-GAP repeat protein
MLTPRSCLLPALFLFLIAPLPAQLVGGQWDTLHQFDGVGFVDYFGCSVAGAGDIDGDGVPDLIVGAYWAFWGALNYGGSAYVYSGATGGLILQFNPPSLPAEFGYSVDGAGDVDGDGVPDLIVGAIASNPGGIQEAGSAFVYSGATGAIIHRFDGGAQFDYLGISVAGAGDVDGDGVPDLIVGSEADPVGLLAAGSAYVYSGAAGGLIHRFDGGAALDYLGTSVAGAGDIDGDGFADLVAGAHGADPSGLLDAGSAYVYSGATGTLLYQFDGGAAGDHLGWSVADAGDIDRDGVSDLIVGAIEADPGGRQNAGSAFVYSGATGALLYRFDGEAAADGLGDSVGGAGDVNGDGVPDLIVGASQADPGGLVYAGSAYLYSGATGALLRRFDGNAAGDRLGNSVAGAGDMDLDGLADLIVGASWAAPGGLAEAGSAYVYSLDPFLHPSADALAVSGGSTVQLGMEFPASEAGARYAVLASITGTGPIVMAGLEIPLTQDKVFDAITSGNVPAPLQGAFGYLNSNAQAAATITAGPALAPVIGQTIYFAAVTYDVAPLTGRMSSVVRYLQITP